MEGGKRLEGGNKCTRTPTLDRVVLMGPGRGWVPWVLGQQARRTGASCWHRSFNYFTLSSLASPPHSPLWEAEATSPGGTIAPLYQAVQGAVRRVVLRHPLCQRQAAPSSSSYRPSKPALDTGHAIKTGRPGIRTQVSFTPEAPSSSCPESLGEAHWPHTCGGCGCGCGQGWGCPAPAPSLHPLSLPCLPSIHGLTNSSHKSG